MPPLRPVKKQFFSMLTQEEVRMTREMLQEWDGGKKLIPQRPRVQEDLPPLQSTDIYYARTPPAGIPALLEDDSTGTGIEDFPGSAICNVYRVINVNGERRIRPYTDVSPGFQLRVHNLCEHSLRGNRYVPIGKAKDGSWVALVGCSEVEADITGTGTGTGTGEIEQPCDDIFTYETDVRCENGVHNVYRRETTLTIDDEGCLVKEYGDWEFWHEAGCCGTQIIDTEDINNYFDYMEGCLYFNEWDQTINININNTWFIFCPCDITTGTGSGGVDVPTGTEMYTGTGTGGPGDPTSVNCLRLLGETVDNNLCDDCSALAQDYDLVNDFDTPTFKVWSSPYFTVCQTWRWVLSWTVSSGGVLELQSATGTVYVRYVSPSWNGTSDVTFTFQSALQALCDWPATLFVTNGPCSQNTGTGTGTPGPVEDCLETACCATTPPTWTVVVSSDDPGLDNSTFLMVYNAVSGKWEASGLPAQLAEDFKVACSGSSWSVSDWTSSAGFASPTVTGHLCDPADFQIVMITGDPTVTVVLTMFGECSNVDDDFTGTGYGPCGDCPTLPRRLVGTVETTPPWPEMNALVLHLERNSDACVWDQSVDTFEWNGTQQWSDLSLTEGVVGGCGHIDVPWHLEKGINNSGVTESLDDGQCLTWRYLDHTCTEDSFVVRFEFDYDQALTGLGTQTGTGIVTIVPQG